MKEQTKKDTPVVIAVLVVCSALAGVLVYCVIRLGPAEPIPSGDWTELSYEPGRPHVLHDNRRNVTCYKFNGSISCVHDLTTGGSQ